MKTGLFAKTGGAVASIEALPRANPEDLAVEHGVGGVRRATLTVRCVTREDGEDLHAMRHVVEARVMPGETP